MKVAQGLGVVDVVAVLTTNPAAAKGGKDARDLAAAVAYSDWMAASCGWGDPKPKVRRVDGSGNRLFDANGSVAVTAQADFIVEAGPIDGPAAYVDARHTQHRSGHGDCTLPRERAAASRLCRVGIMAIDALNVGADRTNGLSGVVPAVAPCASMVGTPTDDGGDVGSD